MQNEFQKKSTVQSAAAGPLAERNEAASAGITVDRFMELVQVSVEVARIVASKPAAPETVLLELARRPDEGVRRRVAANGSSPTKAPMETGDGLAQYLRAQPAKY